MKPFLVPPLLLLLAATAAYASDDDDGKASAARKVGFNTKAHVALVLGETSVPRKSKGNRYAKGNDRPHDNKGHRNRLTPKTVRIKTNK